MNLFCRSGFTLLLALLALPAVGCSGIPVHDVATGTTHHLLLGLGVVSVSGPKTAPEVSAVRIHAIGLAAGTGPAGGLAIGYKSETAVQAAPGSDALVEISPRPFGSISVHTSQNQISTHENP